MVQKQQASKKVWYSLAITRIVLGFIFLWAFLDKLFGLGFATPTARAWVNGGSPTTGFLKSIEGPFADFFNSLAGSSFADWLFMLGLLGLGVALIAGIAIRIAAVGGATLMILMWLASLPLENNPVIDEHIVYALLFVTFAYALSEQRLSLASWWAKQPLVKGRAWLK